MRRLCVLLSIASLCLFGGTSARISHPHVSSRTGAATVASAPMIAAAQLASVIPADALRDSPPRAAAFAVVPAAFVVTARLGVAATMRRRRPVHQLLDHRTARTRGPPAGLRPMIFSL